MITPRNLLNSGMRIPIWRGDGFYMGGGVCREEAISGGFTLYVLLFAIRGDYFRQKLRVNNSRNVNNSMRPRNMAKAHTQVWGSLRLA